jgi:Zn-dependent protease/predicted transcriptional regulator
MARSGPILRAAGWTAPPAQHESKSEPELEPGPGPLGGRAIRLPFTLLGIPVLLDWSFLVVLPLMAYLIGSKVVYYATQFGITGSESLGAPAPRYTLGLLAAVGLFVCVILHELGHAVTARLYGVHVRSITLWFLGGMAHITEMPRRRGGEAVVAIAGPLVSFAISGLLWVGLAILRAGTPGITFLVAYLALVNLLLGAFNLLPALPMDGGRVLRSLLALAVPHDRATRIAGVTSRVVAVLLGLSGLAYGNMFMLFIAFFIFVGVQSETRQTMVLRMLDGVRVGELMTREVKAVPPWLPVSELTRIMLDEHHLGFPVVNERAELVGIVTLSELTSTNPMARVGEIMRRNPLTIGEDAPAAEAFRILGQRPGTRLLVTDDQGRITGILTSSDIVRAIQVRTVGMDWEGPASGERPPWNGRAAS